ncbi:MAG: DUF937 domain-containing protein [Thermonemataceae bacterium]|nr:DUF937 domain-containing protein [Thermonemataceae bacterium]
MNNLFENLTGLVQGDTAKNIAKQFSLGEDAVQKVMAMGLPMILGGLNKNVTNEQGAKNLDTALEKHDGSLLDNIGSLFNGGDVSNLLKDGSGILGHVLGGTQQNAQNQISKTLGLDANTVGNILSVAAPLIMNFLGQQKKQNNLDANGVAEVINNTTKQAPEQEMGLIQKFLDRDGDGNVLDDVVDIGSQLFSSFFGDKKKEENK